MEPVEKLAIGAIILLTLTVLGYSNNDSEPQNPARNIQIRSKQLSDERHGMGLGSTATKQRVERF